MKKDLSHTMNIGMLSAKDGSVLRVKVARPDWYESYRLGEPKGSRINRVLVYHKNNRGFIYFDHRKYAVEFSGESAAQSRKRAQGFHEMLPGDTAVVSMKDKKRRPTTNGAGQIYVIFDATTQLDAVK